MARYHVQTAYARFKVLYEESRTQCRHYVRLLFYELSACHSASEASNTATLYPALNIHGLASVGGGVVTAKIKV